MGKLQALNTPGGHLGILAVFTIAFCGGSIWLSLHGHPNQGIENSFQAAFGALLLMLRGGENKPPVQ